MPIRKEKGQTQRPKDTPEQLKTDVPLSEKDEVAAASRRTKKVYEKAARNRKET